MFLQNKTTCIFLLVRSDRGKPIPKSLTIYQLLLIVNICWHKSCKQLRSRRYASRTHCWHRVKNVIRISKDQIFVISIFNVLGDRNNAQPRKQPTIILGRHCLQLNILKAKIYSFVTMLKGMDWTKIATPDTFCVRYSKFQIFRIFL